MNWKEGEKIKKARLSKDLTQLQLASKVNVSISTISNLELGKKDSISTATLQLIGDELGIKFEL